MYNIYLEGTEEKLTTDPSAFWNFVKSERVARMANNGKTFDGMWINRPQEVAKTLTEHFAFVYVLDVIGIDPSR